jgi:Domain of unknown function (DUF4118)
MVASGAKLPFTQMMVSECPLLGVERKSDFEGGRSVDDPNGHRVRSIYTVSHSLPGRKVLDCTHRKWRGAHGTTRLRSCGGCTEARQNAHNIVARSRIPLARRWFARDSERPVFLAGRAPGRNGVHLSDRTCPVGLVSRFSSLIVLSLIGGGCLNYFFAPPIYSFRVDYPQDLVTIFAFVITSFVVNFLVTRVRGEPIIAAAKPI